MAQNDWKIGLLGGLDGTKSRSQLNSDIKGLARHLDKLKIYAELDPNQAKQLKQQMKTLQIELNNVTVSDAAINGLVTSINNKLKGIQIPNITIGGTGNNNTLSRQLGDNTAKLNAFKDSLKNIGMADSDIDRVAKRIERLGVQINSLGQSTLFKSGASGNREFLNVEIDGIDKFGQAVKLTEQWDLELGTLVKSIDAVSTAQEKASSRVDNFASKQKNAVASFQNTINQVLANALDSNSSKPITSDNSFKLLEGQIDKVELAMTELKSATAATFDDAKIKVQEEISNLKILEKQLKNADNIPTKLKGTNVDAGFDIAFNDLEKFKADAKDYPQIISTIEALDKALEGVGDAASLNKFNDQLKVAKSELAKLKSETMSANRAEKVGINVSGLQSKITDLQKISPEIDNFETEINGAKVTVKSLTDELSKVNTQSDFSVVNTKWRAFTEAAKASGIAVRLMGDNSESSAHKIQKISDALGEGTYTAKVESIVAKTQQWVNANGEAQISTTNLRTALQNLNEAYNKYNAEGGQTEANQKALIAAEEALDTAIKKTNNDITIRNTQFAKSDAVDSLRQKYQDFYDKNTAAHRQWGAQLKAGIAELGSGADIPIEKYKQLQNQLVNIGNAARQAGKLGMSWFDKMKTGMSKFSYWTSSTMVVMKVFQEVRGAITFAKDMDSALTNINYTMDVTSDRLADIGKSSLDVAKDLKTSAKNVLSAVTTYANANETADSILKKSAPTIMLSNVSGLDTGKTTDILQGTIHQFDLEDTEETLLHVSDVLQTVSQSMAVDFSKGIQEMAEGIQVSGSVAKDAGYDLEAYTALLGNLIEKTRESGSVLGRSLRTMFVRTTKASTSALAGGEVTEDDLSNAETALRRVNIQVRDSKDSFREFDDIMSDLYYKIDDLSEVDLANIAYEVAGTRQTAVFKVMVKSWGDYLKLAEKADDATGTTYENQEKYAESLAAKMTDLSTTMDSAWHNIINAEDTGVIVDTLQKIADALDWVTEKAGLLGTIGIGAGLFAGFKNIGICV